MIRFRRDDGSAYPEWEEKKLSEIAIFVGGGTPTTSNQDFWNGNIPWISSSDLEKDNINCLSQTRFITQAAVDKSATKLIKKDSVLLVSRVGLGKVAVAPNDLCTSQDFTNLTNISANSIFMAYLLQELIRHKMKSGQGTTIKGIPSSKIKEYVVKIPCLEEQKKIADFLTSVDEIITATEQEITNLEAQKKGAVQKLFSQEVRFKADDGSDYPKWEEKKLGELGSFRANGVDKLIRPNESLVNMVNYMDVYKHLKITNKNVSSLMQVSAKDAQIAENNLLCGDILFTPSSETPNDIGHSIVIFEDLFNTVYSYHLMRFRPKANVFELRFSHYVCNTPEILLQFSKLSQGTTRFTLSSDSFAKVKVRYPKSLEEQQKIADFLSDFDIAIEEAKKELECWKLIKKGLLQQMFM